jgi:MFS family permease
MRATLRQRNFALLWVGGLLSFIGDWMLLTALPYYVYQRTGSTLATAAMTVASILPSVLLSSVAGVFVDRWDRKRIMVVANLLQTVTVLFLLLVRDGALLWVVYGVALAQSALTSFMSPAENALLPQLVPHQHLLSANALNGLNNTIARLVGPPLGGTLLALLGLEAVIVVDAISFVLAAILIACITLPAHSNQTAAAPTDGTTVKRVGMEGQGVWREWRQGLAVVRNDRVIVTLMVVLGITTFGGTMFDPLYPPFAHDVLHAGAQGLGWVLTAQALGGMLGGVLIGYVGTVFSAARILAWGNMLVGALLLVQFNIPVLPLTLTTAFLIGPEQVAAGAALQTLLQTRVADAYKGRVFGAIGTSNAVLSVLGAGMAGPLGVVVGVVPALNIAACLTISAGVVALLVLPHTPPSPHAVQ